MSRGDSERSQSADRLVEVLRVLTLHGSQRLVDLDRRLPAPRRSLQRLLVSLEGAGLVVRDPDSGRYDLGMGLAVLGAVAVERIDLARVAPSPLRRLHARTGQTGFLLARQGPRAVCAHLATPDDGPALVLPLGRAVPLWQGAVRAILAYLPDAEVAEITRDVPIDDLPARLAEVRAHGWAVGRAEVLAGAIAVAAPVFDPLGSPVACVGALGYDAVLDVRDCADPVLEAAGELTVAIGGRSPLAG
jgi:DNA-binding IclR family transcriptional regulator